MASSLTLSNGACSAPAHLARSALSQRLGSSKLLHANVSAHYNPPLICCRCSSSAFSRKQMAAGWLPKRAKFTNSRTSGRRGLVSMVLGSGGQQQQRSQQGPSTAPAWHPLEDLGPRSKDELGLHEGKLSPAEGARTLVETKEEGVLFTQIFPEGLSDGLDVSYVTDERGDLYFEVDGIEWEGEDAQYLEQEDVTVVVGYTDSDDEEMMDDELDEFGGYLMSDSDSEGSDNDDDSNLEVVGMVDEYLTMLRGRGVPLDDISAESFGTLGAYGGLDTLETVHPLDFAIRLTEAVEASTNPEVAIPQARVTLRGVVELVSPEEERRVRKEWLRRGALAQEEEARHVAASLAHDVAASKRKDGENARKEEDGVKLAQERADVALEKLRQELQRAESEIGGEDAGGSAQAAVQLEPTSSDRNEDLQVERDAGPAEDQPQMTSSMPAGSGADVTTSGESKEGANAAEPSKYKIAALLRRRLKDLNGFPRPGRSRGEGKQGLEDEDSDGSAADSSSEDASDGESEDESETLPVDLVAGLSESLPAGLWEGLPEDVPERLPARLQEGLPTGSPAGSSEGVRVDLGEGTTVKKSAEEVCIERRVDSQAESMFRETGGSVCNDQGPGLRTIIETEDERRPSELTETDSECGASTAAADDQQIGKDERTASHRQNGDPERDGVRIESGAEASTSGSDADGSAAPLEMGGFGRWLTSLEQPESPIIWDQNTGRLWLGRDVQMSGNGLGNGVHGLGGVLWGDAEDDDVESLWRDNNESGDSEEEERPREGPPLYRLRVTSVSFKSPTGAEWQVDVSDYAAAQPDVLCGASATLMEQVNHAGHKVARALVKLCERKLGIEVDDAAMVAVDRYGFDLRVSQGIEMKTLRVSFPEVAFDEHHAMLLLEDMMWLNKKPDKKVFHYRRPPMDDLGKLDGFVS